MSNQPASNAPIVAASYARKSTYDPTGIEAQHAINKKSAEANGHELPQTASYVFEDDFTSGKSSDRKGLNRLMELVSSGNAPFSVLYVKDDDRFGRWSNVRERNAFEQTLLNHGVRLYYGDTPITVFDETSFESALGPELLEIIRSTYAAEEWRKIRSRLMTGKADRIRHGFYPGSIAPYGLEAWVADMKSGIPVRPVAAGKASATEKTAVVLLAAKDGSAAIVKEIFKRAAAGEGLGDIAEDLQARRVPSPGSRKWGPAWPWTRTAIQKILKNPLYKGELIWGRTNGVRIGDIVDVESVNINTCRQPLRQSNMRGDHLVSPEVWHKATVERGHNPGRLHRQTGEGEYLLAGLLRCTGCGAPLTGHTSTKGAKNRRRYYKHERRSDRYAACGVSRTYLPADALENAVMHLVNELLILPDLELRVNDEVERMLALVSSDDATNQRSVLEAEQKRLQAQLRNACDAKVGAESEAARMTYATIEAEVGLRLDGIALELARIDTAPDHLITAAERFKRARSSWPTPAQLVTDATFDERRRCLGALLSRINIHSDSGKMVLHAQAG
jgi:site-specific DNA recombinase